jgi:hypothetical protein
MALRRQLGSFTVWAPSTACVLVALVTGIAILGNLLEIDSLKRVIPGQAEMSLGPATSFFLFALSLLLLYRIHADPTRRLVGRGLAIGGCLALFLSPFHISWTAGESPAGHVTLLGASISVMLGASLLFLNVRRGSRLAETLAVVPAFMGLLSVLFESMASSPVMALARS